MSVTTGSLRTFLLVALVALAGCATRPVNPPLAQADPHAGYRFETRERNFVEHQNLIILAFSGGGTRAAAFSYGVLEALRDIELEGPRGGRTRAIDQVHLIAGVSGGSFTALAFGLYGDRLFDEYESRFLKRNVEGALLQRLASPAYWGSLSSTGWGRSELAADYYDEILFGGATFGDLHRGKGPMIVAAATDVTSGARFYFTQSMFDVICSDLAAVRLSRAAASSSAVPVVLSPVTFNNYGGSCGFRQPPWLRAILDQKPPVRPAARAMRYFTDVLAYEDGSDRPYIHVVDGGVGDNLGMRGVLDVMDMMEALRIAGQPTPLDHVKRLAIVVVNSLSVPKTEFDKREQAPGVFYQFMQSTAVPIDHYSFEAVELLRDVAARWDAARAVREQATFADRANPRLREVMGAPDTEVYVIDVSFAALDDVAMRDRLNELPTSFHLSDADVDQLRAAGARIMHASPEFRRFIKDAGARVVRD